MGGGLLFFVAPPWGMEPSALAALSAGQRGRAFGFFQEKDGDPACYPCVHTKAKGRRCRDEANGLA